MINLPRIRSLAATAVASALLLTACGTSEPQETPAPSPTVEAQDTVEPTKETTPEEPAEEAAPEASPTSQETFVAETTPTRAPVAAGALDGAELNAAGVAWFDAFCSGISEAQSFAGPSLEGKTNEEVVKLAATTYRSMGTSTTATSDRLSGKDTTMNFGNADAFATEVSDIFKEVGQIYWAGADLMESTTFTDKQEFNKANQDISESIIEAGGYDFGITALESTVSDAVGTQVESCAAL